jgi:hypothetical protein
MVLWIAASQAAAAADIQRKQRGVPDSATCAADGVPRLHPIEDPDNVDSRRSAVGLPPLKEYLDHLERQIGKPIERQ